MSIQYTQLEASLVRIFSSKFQDAIVGAGFLISPDTVLTCAHVVTTALNIPDELREAPKKPVLLDFPIVQENEMLKAHACFWEPVAPNGGGDICVLKLDSTPPDGARVARLMVAEKLWGHEFGAIGFPDYYHRGGVSISGELRTRQATGWVQIEGVRAQGFQVQQGFSGGAVWVEQLDGVVGMVVAAEKDPVRKVGYMIPADVLIKAYPPLGQQAIPARPYRGLFAFREEDAPYFFGRETFTRQLGEAIRHKPLLAVVGSSGSGKSSVVFAGLLPLLRKEGSWLFASFRPGSRPFYSLAAALLPLLEPQKSETDRLIESNKLARALEQGELALEDVLSLIMQKLIGTRLLLVADQFEELYTLCEEPEVRQHFLDQLLRAVQALSGQGTVSFHLVLTLRADFVGQALTSRSFADALQYSDLKLGPMNMQELRAAIRAPAKKLHVSIEDGLTERILRDVGQDPGRLPLLEFALTQLWDKQRDGRLTNAAYEEIGGVEKALADHAEEVYAGLNEDEQRRVENIFVQLVQPGSGTEDTRRLTTRAQVEEANWAMVRRLSNARLVVTERDATTGEEAVEVIHEALIRGWQRLRDWIEANREFRLWQERLRNAQKQWQEKGKDVGALLRGALLVEATTWLVQHPEGINPEEQAFIGVSQQHEEQEVHYLRQLLDEAERERLRAEQQGQEAQHQQYLAEQRRQEAEQQRLTAEQHRREAEQQREEANQQRQVSFAQRLAAQSEMLQTRYPHLLERSALLAIEAMQRYPCLEAAQALQHRLDLLPRRLVSLAHQGSVNAVAFSPDGRLLATASGDQTAGVWEVSSGRQVAKLTHQGSVNAVAFSPDGRLLATASEDSTAGVWEVSSGRQVARLSLQNQSGVDAVAFSPDGRLLASASSDTIAGVWEVSSGRLMTTLSHQDESSVNAVAFSPDGRLIATASQGHIVGQGSAEVWEVSSGRRVAMLSHSSVNAVAFSPDGRLIATASGSHIVGEGSAEVWEVNSGRRVATLAHQGNVIAVAFSPDGGLLATASGDQTAGVWEGSNGRRVAMLSHQGRVWAMAFSPDGRLLATASHDSSAEVWEVSSGRRVVMLSHQGNVRAVAFSPDRQLVAIASENYMRREFSAEVWEVSSGRRVAMLSHQRDVKAVAFSPDGGLLATASFGDTAWVWEVSSGRQVAALALQNQSRVNEVAFSPDGRLIAIASRSYWGGEGSAEVWEVSSGRRVATLSHQLEVKAVAFSPDGGLLATASEDSTAGVWEVSSGRQISALAHQSRVNAVVFSLDGRLLATASSDNSARVWEVNSGRRVATLAHQSFVASVVFSRNGQLIATASHDKTAGVWEVPGGRQVVSLNHDEGVVDVAFSHDGRYLVTAGGNAVRVWLWRSEDLIAEAQRRLTRNLTEEEWRQYLGDEPYRKTCPDLP